jgi:hypothetical protein
MFVSINIYAGLNAIDCQKYGQFSPCFLQALTIALCGPHSGFPVWLRGENPPVLLRYSRMTLETRGRFAYDAAYRLHAAIIQERIQTCCLLALAFADSAK